MKNCSYNEIAEDYHLKRTKPWDIIQDFLNFLKEKNYAFNGLCIDLGCANGRNFKIFKSNDNKLIGIDNSYELLKIARKNLKNAFQFEKSESNNIQLILADLESIPIRLNLIDTFFIIATIHHIKTKIKREKTVNQLYNLLNKNGFLILSVWRRWQKKFKKRFLLDYFKRKFKNSYRKSQKENGLPDFGDNYIPWHFSKEEKTIVRFFHFFSKKEIKKLLTSFRIKELVYKGGPTKKDNIIILAQKS